MYTCTGVPNKVTGGSKAITSIIARITIKEAAEVFIYKYILTRLYTRSFHVAWVDYIRMWIIHLL